MISTSRTRTVVYNGQNIVYQLEWKSVKNLNLRIRKDGSIYVSANHLVSVRRVDDFVISKGAYILSSLQHFEKIRENSPKPKQYVSGETFYILGRGMRLKVSEGTNDMIYSDGAFIFLQVKDTDDTKQKERIVNKYLTQQCKKHFNEIIGEIFPLFEKYGVLQPTLRIRVMKTRWGSCLPQKGIITLNKRLLEAPRSCIEYVIMHEFCHFVHPNHSNKFYGFLTMMMPDWKTHKIELDKHAAYWL